MQQKKFVHSIFAYEIKPRLYNMYLDLKKQKQYGCAMKIDGDKGVNKKIQAKSERRTEAGING